MTGSSAATAAEPDSYPFAMGAKDKVVGQVEIWNGPETVFVRYRMAEGYLLKDAHVCIAPDAFPWTAPGQCAFQVDPAPDGTIVFDFEIPYAEIGIEPPACDETVYVQAHGSVIGEESGSAYAGTFKGQVEYVITCPPPEEEDPGCTYTQGFWKNHPGAWPVESLTIGGVPYPKAQLLTVLKTAPKGGDVSMILGHQLIAALLNEANGAAVNDGVKAALRAAEAWMKVKKDADGLLPYGIKNDTNGVTLAEILDRFNNGENGPPHCE